MNDTNDRGNRKTRKPALKDWIRVIKSQGNGLPNVNVHMIVNEATGLVEIESQAPAKDESNELEQKRVQVFKIHSFEVINEPARDPLTRAAENDSSES